MVLTQDNPTMTYGIRTIEAIATAINRDLSPAARSRVPSSEFSPSWGKADEPIAAVAGLPGIGDRTGDLADGGERTLVIRYGIA